MLIEQMPRYYFDVTNGHRLIDPNGLECPHDDAALSAGRTIAQQIAEESPNSARRVLAILDEDRRQIATIKIREDTVEISVPRVGQPTVNAT